jgi:hypothetical protein
MTVRAFESTFAVIHPPKEAPPLVDLREVPAGPARARPLVTWRGEANRFVGWNGWSSASPQGVLTTIRGMAPEAERQSNEVTASRWPAALADPWLVHLFLPTDIAPESDEAWPAWQAMLALRGGAREGYVRTVLETATARVLRWPECWPGSTADPFTLLACPLRRAAV